MNEETRGGGGEGENKKPKGKEFFFPGDPSPPGIPPPLVGADEDHARGLLPENLSVETALGVHNEKGEPWREVSDHYDALIGPMAGMLKTAWLFKNHSLKVFDLHAEACELTPLWEATQKLPTFPTVLESSLGCLNAVASLNAPILDQINPQKYFEELSIFMLRGAPTEMKDVIKKCGASPDPKTTARITKILQRARSGQQGSRVNAVREPMVFAWLPAGLWLCDQAAGAALLNRAFCDLDLAVSPNVFGVHRRALKRFGLQWEKPPCIVDDPPRLSQPFRAELESLGIDSAAVMTCLRQ